MSFYIEFPSLFTGTVTVPNAMEVNVNMSLGLTLTQTTDKKNFMVMLHFMINSFISWQFVSSSVVTVIYFCKLLL